MRLVIEPRKSVTREEFQNNPPHSIALDGYVLDRPKFDPVKIHANFDHHTKVERLATRSTMAQVMFAIQQGLFHCFDPKKLGIYINDIDQDVCMSTRLLKAGGFICSERYRDSDIKNRLERLLELQDKLDCTAGLFACDPEGETIEHASWIFEPYTQSRTTGSLYTMNAEGMSSTLYDVHHRIDDYLFAVANKKKLDVNYEKIGGGNGWWMVREVGYDARIKMAFDGIKAFVSMKELGNDQYHYSIGKISEYIPFPLDKLFAALNIAEGIDLNDTDRRNGGTTIGGSPRIKYSKLTPTQVQEIINNTLSETIQK